MSHLSESLDAARERLKDQMPASPDPYLIAPVPRIALTQQEACASLGCSEEFFVAHVRPRMRFVRRGRKRLFPVDELRRAVDALAEDAV